MKKNNPKLSYFFKPIFFLGFFLFFGFNSFGQNISNVRVSQSEYCSGDEINLIFTITNGNGKKRWFDNETIYNVELSSPSTNTNLNGSFNSNVTPGKNDDIGEVKWSFTADINWPEAEDYRVIIFAEDPQVQKSQSTNSNIFSINRSIRNPLITNKQWNCKGTFINLNVAMDYPVNNISYSWSGPNGFSSNLESPQIEGIEDNSGVYTVELVSKCSSVTLDKEILFVDEDTQDVWRGEVFDNEDFTNSLGFYYEKEQFNQNFGLFNFTWDACVSGTVATNTFSVKYRMQTSRNGIYIVDLGSDNGSTLKVDSQLVYENTNETTGLFGSTTYSYNNVLIDLIPGYILTYDYYEKDWWNQVYFNNLTQLLENKLTENTDQTVCPETIPESISGDSIPSLPNGITKENTGYLWYYSNSESGPKTLISNAVSAEYTPDLSSTPFDAPGTYYLFRQVNLSSTNNGEISEYKISRYSNSAKIKIATDQITWNGFISSDWNTASNWSCNKIPTLQTDVLIPENLASGNYPEISSGTNAFSKNLVIENNASVLVDDNWLRIAGNLTNSGILNSETGSISFEGTSAQIIPNSAFENNRIENLRIDNTSGVNSKSILEITGTLNIESGIFDTGNELTLISDENQTALIDGSGNGEISGLVSMQRYLDIAFGYKYFSSPFQNTVVADFAPYMNFQDPVSSFPNFYRYDENRNVTINDTIRDATGWSVYNNPDNNLNIAEGYALNFGTSATAQTIKLTGEVNNGVIPVRQLENNHREYTKGFHLVGNPYPSPINWNATQGWIRNNIDDGIYFFTSGNTNQYTGTYTSFVNDISTDDETVDGRSSNIIPSMQGFFIKVSDSDTQDLVIGDFGMDNKVRVTNFDQEFLRTQLPEQKSLIRLKAGFTGVPRKDPMVIYFSSFATPNFEKEMDAHKLMNTDPAVPSFYNLTEDRKELSINAIPFPETGSYKKIPLGIKADRNGEMKITLNSIENLSSNFNIYLIDHAEGIGQNLSRKPEYRFDIKHGIHNSRFELMFSEEKVTNPAIAFDEPFSVETRNGDVIVKLNLEKNQQGILRASTMTGQILQTKKGSGSDEIIFNGITSDGVYIINLQLGKNHFAKKVVIKK